MAGKVDWDKIEQLIRGRYDVLPDEGPNKVMSVPDMVRRYIKPGMSICFTNGANVTVREIVRQFYGTKPEFTLVSVGLDWELPALVHCGMVRKAITSIAAELYPNPGPSSIVQRAYREKTLELELFSLYGITQRLMAGAMGVPFVTTKSMIGSDMAKGESLSTVTDPFGSGQEVGVIKAINPDISLVHGWAADRAGNTILRPPITGGEIGWGPRAAKQGTLVTVERIVSTQFVRDHMHLVNLPGYLVRGVCEVPRGAHPDSMGLTLGVTEFEPYADDYDYMRQRRQATKSPELLDAWVKEWTLDCPTHKDYVRKLGHERIASLRGKNGSDEWWHKVQVMLPEVAFDAPVTQREAMVVAAGRKVKASIQANGHEVMLTGVGASGIASWIAYFQLRDQGASIDLMIGSGVYGLTPRLGDPFLTSMSTIRTAKMFSNVQDAYAVIVGGSRSRSIAVLSAGQVDRAGNINSTIMPGDLYLTGAGGGNDAANAREAVVLIAHSKDRLVHDVNYVSAPGKSVRTVVTERAILEKVNGGDELVLTGYFDVGKSEAETVADIKANCGWDLKAASKLEKIAPPTADELTLLRMLDPQRSFTK